MEGCNKEILAWLLQKTANVRLKLRNFQNEKCADKNSSSLMLNK